MNVLNHIMSLPVSSDTLNLALICAGLLVVRVGLSIILHIYCRYQLKTYLVHSEAGDISDPFRADSSYLETLFIDISKPCAFSI